MSRLEVISVRLAGLIESRSHRLTMGTNGHLYGAKLSFPFVSELDSKTMKSAVRWWFRPYRIQNIEPVSAWKRLKEMTRTIT